ncbi:MAG: hypothetical protein ACOX63_08500 [Christensenellales bacterium]|jgi:hypothetical protein
MGCHGAGFAPVTSNYYLQSPVSERKFERQQHIYAGSFSNEAMVFAMENDGRLPPFIVLEMRVPEGEIVVDYAEAHVMPAG